MAFKSALDIRDQHNVQNLIAHRSLIPALANVLASRVEPGPKNPIRLVEMASIMQDQATCIRELEWKLEQMWEVEDESRHHINIAKTIKIKIMINTIIVDYATIVKSKSSNRD